MRNITKLINKILAEASGWFLVVIMILSLLDLSIRNIGESVLGILELAIMVVVAAIFFGLSLCEEKDGHVRVTLFIDRLPAKAGAGIRCLDEFIALLAIIFLTYACGRAAWMAYIGDNAVMAGDVTLYTWPTRFAMTVSLVMYSIQLLLNLVTEVKNFLSQKPSRSPLTENR